MSGKAAHDIGWVGLGRMGEAMAARLVKAGHAISVWNRTASKADPLAQIGAEVVTDKLAMARCATVFTMVSTTTKFREQNPRIYAAVLKAIEEANRLIAADKHSAGVTGDGRPQAASPSFAPGG